MCVMHPAEDKSEPEMTEIKKYQDVEPFAGKMVAVTSDNCSINHKECGVESTIFGYMEPNIVGCIEGGDGYLLHRVLEKNAAGGYPILNNKMINEANKVKIRLTTHNEVSSLRQGIEEGTLKFERLFCVEEEAEERVAKMLDANALAGSSIKPAKR